MMDTKGLMTAPELLLTTERDLFKKDVLTKPEGVRNGKGNESDFSWWNPCGC